MKTTFRIEYRTSWGESLSLVLDDRKYPMAWGDGAIWSVTLEVKAESLKDYTYVVMKDGLILRSEWSHHSSKPSKILEDKWLDCPISGCVFPRSHKIEAFDRPGFRGAGTAVPVFSLRSEDDFGIGDFKDLIPLVDWVAHTGQCVIQLLPVTDTTRKGDWKDSYPYSPISSFALHPLYIRLQDIGVEETESFKKLQSSLNALPEIDYPRVFKEKMKLVRKAFEDHGTEDLQSKEFKKFEENNSVWLGEYIQFCAKRDSNEPEYHAWIQYHLDKQFSEVVAYAKKKYVCFKGDLPIGVSSDSADAYWHPELFNLDCCAGAPPDFFSKDGQNWGFPTYNWEEMAKDDYKWWKQRLRKMSQYFGAFRIDHILGFFRIWEIPSEYKSGLHGHFNPALPYSPEEISGMGLPLEGLFHPDPRNKGKFQPCITPDTSSLEPWQKDRFDGLYWDFFYHRHDAFWERNARKKLPELLSATGMLACGEDLGMVPDCVPGVMSDEGILSLEMACMQKGHAWPYKSVCTTSSHDMYTLRMQQVTEGKADPGFWEVRRILWDHVCSDSMLAIFPLQDWVALDETLRLPDCMAERINDPANPEHHWRYRFHRDLKELFDAADLNTSVSTLLKDSGRIRLH